MIMDAFVVKDSGVRKEYGSGMRRDTNEGKPNYRLIHIPFLTRLALHLMKGAEKYGVGNWQLADSQEELDRMEESAERHMMQWLNGERDEDHAMAAVANIMFAEYVREKINPEPVNKEDSDDLCTIFWMDGRYQVMTYKELYLLNPMIANQIRYFIDGAALLHHLPE